MKRIYIGFSRNLDANAVRRALDLDFASDPESGRSLLEREFGSNYVEPGSFEVYGRNELPTAAWNWSNINGFFPFRHPPLKIVDMDIREMSVVLFVQNEARLTKMSAADIEFVDTFLIQDFDFAPKNGEAS